MCISAKLGFLAVTVMILLHVFTGELCKSVFQFLIVNTIFQSKSKPLIQVSLQYISSSSNLPSILSLPSSIAVQTNYI